MLYESHLLLYKSALELTLLANSFVLLAFLLTFLTTKQILPSAIDVGVDFLTVSRRERYEMVRVGLLVQFGILLVFHKLIN
tara:strand:+ start:63 stop:305 length:243 start_codon:yes stop_codon:yes gene_type:complete